MATQAAYKHCMLVGSVAWSLSLGRISATTLSPAKTHDCCWMLNGLESYWHFQNKLTCKATINY